MGTIRFSQMAFYGYHGVFPEERRLGQRFFINLELDVDFEQAIETDDVTYSVNYGDVYQVVAEIVEGGPYNLIETVADRICLQLLEQFLRVSGVRVEVLKPSAPIPGVFGNVSIQLERRR